MPSKPKVASATTEPESTGAPAPVEAPEPVVFEPATDDEDDDEEEEDAVQDAVPPTAEAAGIDVGGLINQFAVLMAQREQQLWDRLEERLAAITPPSTNGHVREEPAEATGPHGEHPTWMTMPSLETPAVPPVATRVRQQPRMVAFIPKQDPYNPKQTTFKTWINGREIRAKRGQVMILTMGHGIELAKNGHGNCIDIAAMQGAIGTAASIPVQQQPDYSLPNDWDGMPLTNRSSVPVGR